MTSVKFIRCAAAAGLILVGMGAPAGVWAQSVPFVTGVTGTLQAGANLVIAGTGFGTKPVAAPVKWDDFEGGTTGSVVSNGWALTEGHTSPGVAHYPIYSTAVLRPNSTRSVQARFDEGTVPGCTELEGCQTGSSFGIQHRAMPEIYVDAWVNFAPASPEPRNVKLMRVHTNTFAPNLYFNIYCFTDTDGARLGQDGGGTNVTLPPTPWRGSSFFNRNWRHIQMYLRESSPGLSDGAAVLTIDNVTAVNRVGNYMTRTDASKYWDTVWLGNWVGHNPLYSCLASPGNTFIYWDDAYIDNSRAHVEIGDAATYSACTVREIQIPSAWNSSAITVRVHPGSFTNLTNTYLYVTDQNGNVNANGYRLVGGTGDLLSPATVQDLRPKTGS
jgi:hypothetical protein